MTPARLLARRPLVPLAAVALAIAACTTGQPAASQPVPTGQPGGGAASSPTAPTDPAADAEPSAEAVSLGATLAQVRGHHLVALELYRAGDAAGAGTHARHPLHEILPGIRGELEEHGADPSALESALQAAVDAVAAGAPADDVAAAFEAVARLTEEAEAAVLGDVAASPAYRGSVVAALLGTAAHEYEEAVGGGAIRELVEYQDAYGFAGEARRLYAAIEADVRAASDEEADEIEEAFGVLAEALPGPTPPGTLVPVERVEEAAALVGHELEETVGARPLQEADLEAVASEIRHLLDEIVAAYRAGDAERAAELAAEAYLENYEVIEASVIEAAPDVNAELEPLLGAELRRRIGAGAPVEEIERMVARAKELLDRAVEAVEGS